MGHDDHLVQETIAFNRWLAEHRLSRRAAFRGAVGAGVALSAASFASRPIHAAVAAAQGAGSSPNTLIVAWDQVPDNLDPQTARGNRNWWVLAEIYDTLTYLPGGSLDPAPLLAESWEPSPDGITYTFKLRQGVKFTTGAELNADAVKFSIDRLHQIGLGPLYMTEAYDKTDVVDPYTVAFTLKYPYPAWPVILSNPAVLGVIDPAFVEENGGSTPEERNDYVSTNTAGTGAYMLKEWQQGQRIVLAKNPEYWQGWEGSHVDEVVLETVPEESTRLLRLERGDVDIATVTANSLPQLERRIQEQNLPILIQKERDGQPLLSLSTQWLNLNNTMLPTSDINVRKALIHAFNYDLWIETVLKGFGLRMEGMIPRGVLGHVDDYPSYPYDLAMAKEFLDQASPEAKAELEKGLPFRYSPGYVIQKEGALLWQQDLDQIGITLNLEEVDQATLASLQTSAPGVPIVEARWFPDYPDPDNFINAARPDYWPPEGYGAAFAGDEKTADLIARGRAEQDPEQRAAIYRELELYFHEQASILMLAELSGVINPWNARATWVQGFEHNPMIHPLYYHVWKDAEA
jgi:peptide/nickel transport system substrate-binding protein